MAPTPQTNASLKDIARVLSERDDFVICGHVSPDGDCLGSQLALMHALRSLGKRACCLLARDESFDARLAYLPGAAELVPAASYEGPARTFVAVDVPMRDRMGSAAAALLDRSEVSITIDHHAFDETMTDYVHVDPAAASTTMLIWQVAHLLGTEGGRDLATCCYTGLVTDTGRFQYQNTDAAALAAAADMVAAGANPAAVARAIYQNRSQASVALEGLAIDRMKLGAHGAYALSWLSLDDFARTGAARADAEPLIDTLRSLAGVRVACMLREQKDSVRGSFRAKDDTDVAALARGLGGGGHKAAAGFTIAGPLEAAVERIDALLAGVFADAEDAVAAAAGTDAAGERTA